MFFLIVNFYFCFLRVRRERAITVAEKMAVSSEALVNKSIASVWEKKLSK